MTYILYLLVIVSLCALDQFTKYLIVSHFSLNEAITIIKNFFDIRYIRNYGAGFSILQNETSFLYMISFIAIIGLGYLLITSKKTEKFNRFCYLLIISGALGNLIDRLRFTYVVDFFDFVIFNYDFPVFNVADIYITIGCVLLILSIILENKNAKY